MTRERRFEVIEQIKELQKVDNNMNIRDCIFSLYYDKRKINGKELDYLMDWMTL